MKRINSLVGSIIGTVVNGIQAIVKFISIFAVIAALSLAGAGQAPGLFAFVIAVYVLLEAFMIVAFVLTCITFSYINADHEKYASKKGITIATIVFNFIIAFLFLIACAGVDSVLSIVFSIICAVALVAVNILYIIDLSKENERAKANQKQETIAEETEHSEETEHKEEV